MPAIFDTKFKPGDFVWVLSSSTGSWDKAAVRVQIERVEADRARERGPIVWYRAWCGGEDYFEEGEVYATEEEALLEDLRKRKGELEEELRKIEARLENAKTP